MMQVYPEFQSLESESLVSLLVLCGVDKLHVGIVPNTIFCIIFNLIYKI